MISELDPRQAGAVMDVEGPVLVYAGAGSGKTRVMTYRVAHMIDEGIDPDSILCITFTNKAADEMRSRIVRLVGPAAQDMWIGTFHSTCARILREFAGETSFTIVDEEDTAKILRRIVKELGLTVKVDVLKDHITRAKQRLLSPEDYRKAMFEETLEQARIVFDVYEAYQQELARMNAFDFDDLIVETVCNLSKAGSVYTRVTDRFRYICVDEYQDTACADAKLISLLSARTGNVTVVGDPRQSIFSFRGADYRIIMDFEKEYHGAKTHVLDTNYRSRRRIVDAAEAVIAHNTLRPAYTCRANREGGAVEVHVHDSDCQEAAWLANTIAFMVRYGKISYRDIAILYRVHGVRHSIEDIFIRRKIPYTVIGGIDYFDRQEIKDVASYLRFLVNTEDSLAIERALGVPRRGIGRATVDKIRAFADSHGVSIWSILSGRRPDGLERAAWKRLQTFYGALSDLRSRCAAGATIPQVLQAIYDLGFEQYYKRDLQSGEIRWSNLQRLKAVAAEHPGSAVEALPSFVERIALDPSREVSADGKVKLISIHSAKGLEFPNVFVIGMEEGLFPYYKAMSSAEELEEERRLCYVAMTRAMDRLYLSAARARTLYNQPVYANPSRFLEEIGDHAKLAA